MKKQMNYLLSAVNNKKKINDELIQSFIYLCTKRDKRYNIEFNYKFCKFMFTELSKSSDFRRLFVRFINNESTKINMFPESEILYLFEHATNINAGKRTETKTSWEVDQGHYHYIPYESSRFLNLLRQTKKI